MMCQEKGNPISNIICIIYAYLILAISKIEVAIVWVAGLVLYVIARIYVHIAYPIGFIFGFTLGLLEHMADNFWDLLEEIDDKLRK